MRYCSCSRSRRTAPGCSCGPSLRRRRSTSAAIQGSSNRHHMVPVIDRRGFIGLAGAAAFGGLLLSARSGGAPATNRFAVNRSPAEWRRILGPQRYAVLREASTETAYTSPLLNEHRRGTFVCAGCALPLFSS